MKRILLIGGFGNYDNGDEAQLTAVITNIKKLIPNTHLTLLSENVENTRSYHHEETCCGPIYHMHTSAFPRRQPRKQTTQETLKAADYKPNTGGLRHNAAGLVFRMQVLFRSLLMVFNAQLVKRGKEPIFENHETRNFLFLLKNSDLLFNVGGGNLTSTWKSELHSKCLMYILCRIFDKPIILSGQTIGPFHGILDRLLAWYALNKVNLITLRERNSAENLKNIKVTTPPIRVTADDATTLAPIREEEAVRILETEGISPKQRPLIGINMNGLTYLKKSDEKYTKAKRLLAEVADHLVNKYNATIAFIPMQLEDNDDRIPMKEIAHLMQNRERAFVFSHYTDRELKGIIGQLDLAIGLRYHFVVFAVNSSVPAVGLYLDDYYSTKMTGILELIGQKTKAINIDEASTDKIVSLAEEMLSNKKQIASQLSEQTRKLENLSLFSIRQARQLLSA